MNPAIKETHLPSIGNVAASSEIQPQNQLDVWDIDNIEKMNEDTLVEQVLNEADSARLMDRLN